MLYCSNVYEVLTIGNVVLFKLNFLVSQIVLYIYYNVLLNCVVENTMASKCMIKNVRIFCVASTLACSILLVCQPDRYRMFNIGTGLPSFQQYPPKSVTEITCVNKK